MPTENHITAEFRKNPKQLIGEKINSFVRDSHQNRLAHIDGGPIFENPVVAYANGDDPIFEDFKKAVGPFHLTPRQALEKHLEGLGKSADLSQIRFICWVLPIAMWTRLSNRKETLGPSLKWAHTRFYGEQFNDALRRYLAGFLTGLGYDAMAPVLAPFFERLSLPNGPASNWSERHMQYAAGQGTFSLSDGFITPKGIAMRCGSVVVNFGLEPTPRAYRNHVENCLFYRSGTCDKCIWRCPAGAITEAGHDKVKCNQYFRQEGMRLLLQKYQVEIAGCGLCQTGVPCEAMIPKPSKEAGLSEALG